MSVEVDLLTGALDAARGVRLGGPSRGARPAGSRLAPARGCAAQRRGLLEKVRAEYEPYAVAISRQLALDLSDWLARGEERENWRAVSGRRAATGLLALVHVR